MSDFIFVDSPVNVLRGDAARVALQATNDAAHITPGKGVLEVPIERWEAAQVYERDTWLTYGLSLTEDRNTEHAAMFDGYKALPDYLGNIVELGCGPFTNLRHILPERTVARSVLIDPLASEYQKHHPNCAYKEWTLCGNYVDVVSLSIEEIADLYKQYDVDDQYDVVVIINVLHHCQNALKVFSWINDHLKTGGYLVFHEPVRDIDPTQWYDVGHPLSFNQSVLDDFLAGYSAVYRNGDYFIGTKK